MVARGKACRSAAGWWRVRLFHLVLLGLVLQPALGRPFSYRVHQRSWRQDGHQQADNPGQLADEISNAASSKADVPGTARNASAAQQLPPVDVVYTWVQGTEPGFRARYKAVIGNDIDCQRQLSSADIYISLTALCHFAPWVNHVYIAVSQQRFSLSFLSEECREKTSFVDHVQFIPKDVLPTYNSYVIEANLHRIPGLQNHYLYFNDDMALGRPLPKSSLFSSNGLFKAQLQPPTPEHVSWLRTGQVHESNPWDHPLRNAALLFMSAFQGAEPPGQDLHGISALTIEAAAATWNHFGPKLQKTMGHKLRRYALLEDEGDVHFNFLAQRVGVHRGLLTLEDHLSVHIVHQYDLEHLVPALFHDSADSVVTQMLWALPEPQLLQLCWLARWRWCQPEGQHCNEFLQLCSAKATCDVVPS